MAKAEVIVHLDEATRMTLEARIAELETEQGELHRELARLRSQLASAREDASEMEKKAIAEGSEALALRAEVAALKAAATWKPMDTAPRDGTWLICRSAMSPDVWLVRWCLDDGGCWVFPNGQWNTPKDSHCWWWVLAPCLPGSGQ